MKFFRQNTPLLLIVLGTFLLLYFAIGAGTFKTSKPATPTRTAEPIFPTRTKQPEETLTDDNSVAPVIVTPRSTIPVSNSTDKSDNIFRFGLSGSSSHILLESITDELPVGSFLNWQLVHEDVLPKTAVFWPMIRLQEEGMRQSWEELEQAVLTQPTATFLVGNEMDVKWQDNVTAPRYAVLYHDIYHFIKDISPEAKVAIGGVSQSTPLRREYLDLILETYEATYGEKMPIDVWNVHAFVLREERGSWGVDIPPGFEVDEGTLYEIDDHNDLDIFRQNLVDFRQWMVERDYGDKPLLVSEYGILMPPDFGFSPEITADFMTGTWDIMLELANETGYATDENRLVQWWVWYIIYDQEPGYPAGNILDLETDQLTEVGQAWKQYFE